MSYKHTTHVIQISMMCFFLAIIILKSFGVNMYCHFCHVCNIMYSYLDRHNVLVCVIYLCMNTAVNKTSPEVAIFVDRENFHLVSISYFETVKN